MASVDVTKLLIGVVVVGGAAAIYYNYQAVDEEASVRHCAEFSAAHRQIDEGRARQDTGRHEARAVLESGLDRMGTVEFRQPELADEMAAMKVHVAELRAAMDPIDADTLRSAGDAAQVIAWRVRQRCQVLKIKQSVPDGSEAFIEAMTAYGASIVARQREGGVGAETDRVIALLARVPITNKEEHFPAWQLLAELREPGARAAQTQASATTDQCKADAAPALTECNTRCLREEPSPRPCMADCVRRHLDPCENAGAKRRGSATPIAEGDTGTAPAPPLGVPVAIGRVPWVAKTKRQRTDKFQADISGTSPHLGTIEYREGGVEARDEEVLEVRDGVVTKLRVTFAESASWGSRSGKTARDRPSVINEKTFIVTAGPKGPNVRTGADKKSKQAEAAATRARYPGLGKPDAVAAALPPGVIEVGTKVPALAAALTQGPLRSLLACLDGMDYDTSRAKLMLQAPVFVGGDKGEATFTLNGEATSEEDGLRMTFLLTGHLRLRTDDGRPTSISLEGKLKAESGDDDGDRQALPELKGNLQWSTRFTYE